MDAGFFRVSRSAGIWGEVRGSSVRPGRGPKLGTVWPARRGFEDPDDLRASGRSPLPCGGDRCAPAQSPPPGSSPLRGSDGRRKMAAGMGRSGTPPPACLVGPAGRAARAAGSWGLVGPRGGSPWGKAVGKP